MNKSSSHIEDSRSLETMDDINDIYSVQTKREKAHETDVSSLFYGYRQDEYDIITTDGFPSNYF